MTRFPFSQVGLSVLITILCFILNGCATTRSRPLGVSTESRSGAGVEIQSVHLRTNANGLMVSGVVRRTFGYTRTLQSHLDVEVVTPDGNSRKKIAINYLPRPIPRSLRIRKHSDFAVQLPEVPPPGSVVRVTHHPVSSSKCPNVSG